MIKKISLITLIALSVFIAGCGNKQTQQLTTGTPTNNQSDVNISQPTGNTTTLTKQDRSTTNPTGSITSQTQEIFYGQWVITKVLAYGPVGTYSNDDIKIIVGRKLSFSKEKASCFGDQIKDLDKVAINPVYEKIAVSKSEFANDYRYRLTFDNLGITSDSITKIYAVDAKHNGCIFYIKDNDTLILYGGGVYFKLDKVTQN
jgi:hypothetical protein